MATTISERDWRKGPVTLRCPLCKEWRGLSDHHHVTGTGLVTPSFSCGCGHVCIIILGDWSET